MLTTGRKGDTSNRQVVQRLQQSGSFSWLDEGISRNGYSLLIVEPAGKRANTGVVLLGALTIMDYAPRPLPNGAALGDDPLCDAQPEPRRTASDDRLAPRIAARKRAHTAGAHATKS